MVTEIIKAKHCIVTLSHLFQSHWFNEIYLKATWLLRGFSWSVSGKTGRIHPKASHTKPRATWVPAVLVPPPRPSPWQHCWFHVLMCMQSRHSESTCKEEKMWKAHPGKVQQMTVMCACRTKKKKRGVACLPSSSPQEEEEDVRYQLFKLSVTYLL